ncbi:MAG: YggS family pyridoxal phosphate-dependent enzyme [Methylobacteriaceae bacterium]|nr:YggS family pyridoxal phosphate-dependent enzyme [Methylobacteriaceae bacterium]
MPDVVTRLAAVRADIARASADSGRPAGAVTLVAVSKTFPGEAIWPAIEAGQAVFGENRVQEARAKWPELRARAAAAGRAIELHLIGPLQSNKAREAVELFDVIETVDRDKIAAALAAEMRASGRRPRLFVQINTGAEPQKAGVAPAQAEEFLVRCREVHGLTIEGLMCIPPVEELAAPHFALLAQIAARAGLKGLSMGMSADYALAIQLGATHVRIGSAIFGSR